MENIPAKIQDLYIQYIKEKDSSENIPLYIKWLKYYLDFCRKYSHNRSSRASLEPFLSKLKQKNQSEEQIEQAEQAINFFFLLIETHKKENQKQNRNSSASKSSCKNQRWSNEYNQLKEEITLRQYSVRTLRSYTGYVRKFQAFLKSKPPDQIDSSDAKSFITYLAVDKKVSASTQNLAFNSLLFFFRHVLKKDFGNFENVPRAKRSKYTPTVLSREEIDEIIENLHYPYDLVIKLLYGCGLRLSEGVNLRVHDFDFYEKKVTIYGKGRKFRKVLLPKKIIPDLQEHLQRVKKLHKQDMAKNYAGVFMPDQVERKYKNSAKELALVFVPIAAPYRSLS